MACLVLRVGCTCLVVGRPMALEHWYIISLERGPCRIKVEKNGSIVYLTCSAQPASDASEDVSHSMGSNHFSFSSCEDTVPTLDMGTYPE